MPGLKPKLSQVCAIMYFYSYPTRIPLPPQPPTSAGFVMRTYSIWLHSTGEEFPRNRAPPFLSKIRRMRGGIVPRCSSHYRGFYCICIQYILILFTILIYPSPPLPLNSAQDPLKISKIHNPAAFPRCINRYSSGGGGGSRKKKRGL